MSLTPFGWLLGLVAFGGLVVLAIAGLTAATAILVTAFAIVGMIALGGAVGGRRSTPNRVPYPAATEGSEASSASSEVPGSLESPEPSGPADPEGTEPQ